MENSKPPPRSLPAWSARSSPLKASPPRLRPASASANPLVGESWSPRRAESTKNTGMTEPRGGSQAVKKSNSGAREPAWQAGSRLPTDAVRSIPEAPRVQNAEAPGGESKVHRAAAPFQPGSRGLGSRRQELFVRAAVRPSRRGPGIPGRKSNRWRRTARIRGGRETRSDTATGLGAPLQRGQQVEAPTRRAARSAPSTRATAPHPAPWGHRRRSGHRRCA